MSLLCPRPSLSSSRISHSLSAPSRSLCSFLLHSSASANTSLVFFDLLVSALRYRSFVLSFLSFFCAHEPRARAASFHVVVGVCRVAAARFVLFVVAHEARVLSFLHRLTLAVEPQSTKTKQHLLFLIDVAREEESRGDG